MSVLMNRIEYIDAMDGATSPVMCDTPVTTHHKPPTRDNRRLLIMAAIYSVYTSPTHPPIPNHLPTLIVTPHGNVSRIYLLVIFY